MSDTHRFLIRLLGKETAAEIIERIGEETDLDERFFRLQNRVRFVLGEEAVDEHRLRLAWRGVLADAAVEKALEM